MTRLLLPALCGSLALLLAACSSTERVARELDTARTPAAVIRADVAARAAELRTLTGRGAIAFDTPELSGTAAFASTLRRPDSLLVFLEGPLGIDVGSLFLSRERYVVVNSMENSVFTGNPSAASLRSLLPVDLNADQLLDLFAGIITLPDGDPDEYTVEDGLFRLAYRCGPMRCEYWVDPAEGFVIRHRRSEGDGTTVVEATCSGLTRDAGAVAARKVTLRFPGMDRRVSIAYSDLTLNTADISFSFRIPPGARTVER